ncbi:phospholipase [Halioglobus maricola]|uniref:Phospholipase n=1 Tax=Halioglobus maricola TaxID=2601894 RepID=A0A5P9NNC7_9GAMM|nr:C45 family autoproteolytic acyltransferase/hydolase [Halioglobus maricola]QFU77159.1 phospholipase [Halioglobus maricola]
MSELEAPSLEGAYRENSEGWIRLHIAGSPRQRGYQHGYLLANELRAALREIDYLLRIDTGIGFDWFARNAEALYMKVLPKAPDGFGEELLEELQGIVDGVNAATPDDPALTLADLLGWNGYPEMICQWYPAVMSGHITPNEPLPWDRHATHAGPLRAHHFHHSCSAFVATGDYTADGGPVAVHTTWQRFANGDAYNVLLHIRPESGHDMVMQSVPGYVYSSTDFSVTGGGLIVTETSLDVAGFEVDGLPEWLRTRRACQYGDSIESWCALFSDGNNGGYVNTWFLAEVNTGRIAAYELTLNHSALQPPLTSGYYAGCNIPLDETIRAQTGSGATAWSNLLGSAGRRIRWDQLMAAHRGNIDQDIARQMLGDHGDMYTGEDCASSRTICGHLDNDNGQYSAGQGPFYPWGSLDGKVATAGQAKALNFDARWGRACGAPLDVEAFLSRHPQYGQYRGHMQDRPSRGWIKARAV